MKETDAPVLLIGLIKVTYNYVKKTLSITTFQNPSLQPLPDYLASPIPLTVHPHTLHLDHLICDYHPHHFITTLTSCLSPGHHPNTLVA